ncbi:MAG: phosphoglycerate kinase [Patescibacteria group bacterium]
MKFITEAGDLKGKRVLVRVDWSVPMHGGKVIDDYAIRASLPTLQYLVGEGAQVLVATHLESTTDSIEFLEKYLPVGATLLPNLRANPGEEENSEEFARELAAQADIYVNDAFSVSHREHASLVGVPKLLPSYAGLRFAEEVRRLSQLFYPKHPFLFIVGGAKFDTKLPLLKKFVNIADDIFVGGALANNFFKERGEDVGSSLVSGGDFGLADLLASGKILLPEDTITVDDKILDVGPVSLETLKEKVNAARMILWNGPLGSYENGYKVGTLALARMIAESGKESFVGGGDTLSAIHELKLFDKFSFISTGGGAMITFLATGTLPAIEALK